MPDHPAIPPQPTIGHPYRVIPMLAVRPWETARAVSAAHPFSGRSKFEADDIGCGG
ncbi:hypothetical protein [Nocardia australiensis]|uniref:hypothetical protein n=1 Tax=Nocardia australiensis TaxID=2887191 RepID=UPI001D14FA2E|nr:hypothetical protein [Nocardia australiensis]